MDYKNIITTIRDYVATITLNRPDNMNTFTTVMARELDHTLLSLDSEDTVRVIILKGAGGTFCAGIDVSEFPGKTAIEYQEWIGMMGKPMITMNDLRKPVIAQVQGIAAAIGAGLVAAADLAIVSERARFGLTAINVGLNCIGPAVPLTRCVGRKKALELLLFGDLIDAAEAHRMGLVNRVVKHEELDDRVLEWAQQLAQKSPLAVETAKKAFYTAADMEYHKAFEHVTGALARLCTTEDVGEGIAAFFEKRKPQWKRR
ncbi:MAG: enoyl-CoA hydratase-related protein [Syntrophorhabdaceae bacterium]|nr:enoyl-CoA hydratase-related protein [Syntrophorhabdaceae bacterium]MDD4195715.1 enoyl-CoA hydratase-related protein [Syntrophorhabdaceae bacterium]HOC46781.1 enoyl-CoA hydratase-related protein [Syntrophorhabdaceae bacterium]